MTELHDNDRGYSPQPERVDGQTPTFGCHPRELQCIMPHGCAPKAGLWISAVSTVNQE